MIEKIIFNLLAFAIFIVIFGRFIKKNDTSYVYVLGLEFIGIAMNFIELIFDKEYSNKIDGEKVFEDAYKISRMFRFMFKNDRLIIILDILKLDKHYIYYLVELLDKITFNT